LSGLASKYHFPKLYPWSGWVQLAQLLIKFFVKFLLQNQF
jgi:hypothetical protein